MKQTHIAVTARGKPIDHPGFWTLGYDEKSRVWGLAYAGVLTHMCYGDYASPSTVRADTHWGDLFHFDVGNEICVTREELCAAFDRLGI